MPECEFQLAWIGPCRASSSSPLGCNKHRLLVCVSCGEPATHECSETGQFVCGEPLCDDCEHTITADGTNGNIGFYVTAPFPEGIKAHCNKTDQKELPWYARERVKQ